MLGGEPAGVRGLCLSCLGPEQGSRVETQHTGQVSPIALLGSIQMLQVKERAQTPREGTAPALAGSQRLGDRAAVLPSPRPSGLAMLQRHCRASAGGMWEQLPDNAVQLCAFTLGNAPEPHCSGLLSCLFLWKLLSKERGRQTNIHRVVPGARQPARELGFGCSCRPGAGWAGCGSHCDPSVGLRGAQQARGVIPVVLEPPGRAFAESSQPQGSHAGS